MKGFAAQFAVFLRITLTAAACAAVLPAGPAAGAVPTTAPHVPSVIPTRTPAPPPAVGFTFHWDFINSQADAARLLAFAADHGAKILNVVPPAHIWEQPDSLATLRWLFAQTQRRHIAVTLNRIDGSSFAATEAARQNWLYTNILTEPARLPSGLAAPSFFLATVGNPAFERWLREETAYYARHFAFEPNLVSFSVGGFNEPFVSQRGSLLCWDDATGSYELAQYTAHGAALWHRFLARHGSGLRAINARYGTRFARIDDVPMPLNEHDPAFPRAPLAYWDLVRVVNDWFVAQFDDCRRIWRREAVRPVPFVLQFNTGVPEKFAKGRLAFAALDIVDWMTRADALGLSLYTNCGYPDWGQASARAMVNQLRLAGLLGRPVLVLEAGTECDGALRSPEQFAFLGAVARSLAPTAFIYEFLKMSYCENFATAAGKLLDPAWHSETATVAAVTALLADAAQPAKGDPPFWVLDLPIDRGDEAELAARQDIARAAMGTALARIPPAVVDRLPAGAVLVVPDALDATARARLRTRGIALVERRSFLATALAGGAQPHGGNTGPGRP